MTHRFYRYFVRKLSLVAPIVAALASVTAMSSFFLKGVEETRAYPLTIGVLASMLGAVVAYALARTYKLASRHVPAVFISYSHKDAQFAEILAAELERMDVEPIIDRLELKVGDDIRSAVDDMIDRSEYFLFVISRNSAASDWAKKEIEQAIKRDKRILPVVLDVGSIPEQLSGMYYADFTEDIEGGLAQLKKTLQPKG